MSDNANYNILLFLLSQLSRSDKKETNKLFGFQNSKTDGKSLYHTYTFITTHMATYIIFTSAPYLTAAWDPCQRICVRDQTLR